MKFLACFFFFFLINSAYSQNPFIGKLVYKIEIADSTLRNFFPTSQMTIYTNDTIVRVETFTDQLGGQVMINHLQKQKGYLLVERGFDKFAIQIPENDSSASRYSYEKKRGKKKVLGMKSKKLQVRVVDFPQDLDFFYNKKISSKSIPGFESFPGLLTDYFVVSKDGVYHYELIEINNEPLSKDLFGIPSDYKRISMSDFVDVMTGGIEGE